MPWGKHLLLVALTGWGQEEDRQRSKDAGFDTHMVKPVDFDALLKLVASLPATDAQSQSA
jgi:CheY-like chemotaxis protein